MITSFYPSGVVIFGGKSKDMTYPKQDSSPDVESDYNISYRSSEENSGDSDVVED
ncbi:hypothetical protein MKW92_036842, partial [Papaver armeniacum]